MAVSPGDHSTNWLTDILSWDKLMYVFTIFSILVSSAIIPVYHIYKKRHDALTAQLEKQQLERIDISLKPVLQRLDEMEQMIKELQHETSEIRRTMEDLYKEFRAHQIKIENINKKVYFVTGLINRQNIGKFGMPGDDIINDAEDK